MANEQSVTEIISAAALASVDALTAKLDKSVQSLEKLVAAGVQLNNALGNAKALDDMNTQIEQLTINSQKLADAETKLKKNNDDLKTAEDALKNARAQQLLTQQASTDAAKQQAAGLNENLKALNDYQARIRQIKTDQKNLATELKTGAISANQYAQTMDKLSKEELRLKNVTQNLAGTIKQQIKNQDAAAGSVDQLSTKLALLQKTYDALGKSQRNSSAGKEVKAQLSGVNAELSKLEGNTGRFQRNVGNYQSALSGISGALGAIGISITVLSGIKQIFSDSIDEALQAEKAVARFKNTLDNVGKSDSFERLAGQADDLAKSFGYIDNDDVTEVFNKLFTYGKLTEKQISDLTPVIIDFAAKTGNSLEDSSDIIIKALEGNGKAVKTLGIDFKETHSVADRLGVVMTTLKGKVDGAGQAFGATLAGQVAIANQHLKDVEEELGNKLLPAWTKFKTFGLDAISGLIKASEKLRERFIEIYGGLFNTQAYQEQQLAKARQTAVDQINAQTAAATQYAKSIQNGIIGLGKEIVYRKQLVAEAQAAAKANPNSNALKFESLRQSQYLKALEDEVILRKEINKEQTKPDQPPTPPTRENDKFSDAQLKDKADNAKKEQEIDAIFLQQRLKSAQDEADAELAIADRKYKTDIANAEGKEKELAYLKLTYNNQKQKIEQTYNDNILKYYDQYHQKVIAGEEELTKTFIDEQAKRKAAAQAALADAKLGQVSNVGIRQDSQLQDLEARRAAGLISEKEYADARVKIEQDAADDILSIEIDFAKKALDSDDLTNGQRAAIVKQIADYELQLTQHKNEQIVKSEKDKNQAIMDDLAKVQEVYSQVTDVIGGLVDNNITAQKNAIQELIDKNDAQAQHDIAAVDASTASAQEKADKIAVINVKSQAQKEALERRQKQLDLQRAKFDKAKAIGSIILNTAQAVTKFLAEGNIAFSIIAGIIGAAQLAVAAAQPLPQFAHGTTDAPGGLAIVGDGGKHEYIAHGGKITETPNVPTVMNVPKHAVIYPDHESMLRDAVNPRWGGSMPREEDDAATLEELRRLNRTIKNKTENHWHRKKDGWERIKNGSRNLSERF